MLVTKVPSTSIVSKWDPNPLVTNILQTIFFCIPQKKEMHTGLEWHDGDEKYWQFSFLGECLATIFGHFSFCVTDYKY